MTLELVGCARERCRWGLATRPTRPQDLCFANHPCTVEGWDPDPDRRDSTNYRCSSANAAPDALLLSTRRPWEEGVNDG